MSHKIKKDLREGPRAAPMAACADTSSAPTGSPLLADSLSAAVQRAAGGLQPWQGPGCGLY